jgi:hypothetical protein
MTTLGLLRGTLRAAGPIEQDVAAATPKTVDTAPVNFRNSLLLYISIPFYYDCNAGALHFRFLNIFLGGIGAAERFDRFS